MGTSSHNIHYKTDGIVKFFEGHRDKWEDFYPSEKWAFEKISGFTGGFGRILDAGCAMGGLGMTLSGRFPVKEYIGIDINPPAIERAKGRAGEIMCPSKFECSDILELDTLKGELFDTVFSLSCADWNIDTNAIIKRCWEYVKPGGHFVISLRLTPGKGINDIKKSYQAIYFDKNGRPMENANYVVFNGRDFLRLVRDLRPGAAKVMGYGYWGKPASNATTPYADLVFAVFIVTKGNAGQGEDKISAELCLPLDLFC